jgi:hypothetical protein
MWDEICLRFGFADITKPFTDWSMGTGNRTPDAAVSIQLLHS